MTELKEISSGLIWEERFTASFRPMPSQTKTTGSENPKALEPEAAASPVTVPGMSHCLSSYSCPHGSGSVVAAGDSRARPRLFHARKERVWINPSLRLPALSCWSEAPLSVYVITEL